MRRYTVELWDARDGEPDRMPDAIVTVTAADRRDFMQTGRGYRYWQDKAENRAVAAAQYRAERAAGSRGRFDGPRGIWVDWADWNVTETCTTAEGGAR